jgi:hypothetical protein
VSFAAESRKINAQDARLASLLGGYYGGGNAAAFFGPSAYLFMIGGGS